MGFLRDDADVLLKPNIAVLGAGNMGSALAHALACQGNAVRVWDFFPDVVEEIITRRQNSRFLPDITLDARITAKGSVVECVEGADMVIVAVPSAFIESTLTLALPHLAEDAVLINLAKGFSPNAPLPLVQELQKMTPFHPWVHLAGPCLATEIAQGTTSFMVLASDSTPAAEKAATWFRGHIFQPTVSKDIIGAALGGILKNVYAILLGCFQKLHTESKNLEAVVITACIKEMTTLSTVIGGEKATVYGLCGLGDLIATSLSPSSHNRTFGELLASGLRPEEIKKETGWLPEGVLASEKICSIAQAHGISVPLAEWVCHAINEEPPTLEGLMSTLKKVS